MAEVDIYSGLTLAGATTALDAILSATLYAKLHVAPAFDGTLNASVITARQAVDFGPPDSNGVYDLDAPFSFTPIVTAETLWGVSLWTASTAGICRMVRSFEDMKTVFAGDTLTVVSMPVVPTVVGL
jgi:hypothetical protein